MDPLSDLPSPGSAIYQQARMIYGEYSVDIRVNGPALLAWEDQPVGFRLAWIEAVKKAVKMGYDLGLLAARDALDGKR